jgi:hypothetical protein
MFCSEHLYLPLESSQTAGSCKSIATVCKAKLSPRRPAFSIRPAEHHEVYHGEVRLETTLRYCLVQLALELSISGRWGKRRDRERAKRRISHDLSMLEPRCFFHSPVASIEVPDLVDLVRALTPPPKEPKRMHR